MSRLRIAVVGCGGMGAMHARTLHRHATDLICCDVLPERAQALAGPLGAAVRPSVEEAIACGLDVMPRRWTSVLSRQDL